MSYLEDPRVFLATERTLLAWIRTEISILAIAFILMKFGVDEGFGPKDQLSSFSIFLCLMTLVLSVLSSIQAWIGLSRLSAVEVPGPLAKPLVLLSGLISIAVAVGATYLIFQF